jgi:rhodanese-related sulfurtransferase
MACRILSPRAVKDAIHARGEVALLDVRENGQYGEGHLFFASNCPYSRLEILIPRLVPNLATLCILYDDGDGVAEKAAARLTALGYSLLAVLEGGAPGWRAANFTLFQGVNVPSKAFGELMEAARHTPTIAADQLEERRKRGDALLLIDGRPFSEFEKMSIPGARCVPNGELLYRFGALVGDDCTTIVINCAGRTRGLVGAQSLIDAGIRNPVYALEDGTQGWVLAGRALDRGKKSLPLPELDDGALRGGANLARQLARTHGVPVVSPDAITEWRQDAQRTLYLFDVRTEQEYLDGHIAGSGHAPAVQLVQATDEWVAVRGARIALIDDNGVRATAAASWLRQMGHDVVVVANPLHAMPLARGREEGRDPGVPTIRSVAALSPADLGSGTLVIDLRPSMAYRQGRIPGSLWSIRPRLHRLDLRGASTIVLVADDPRVAQLAALDLTALSAAEIRCLESGVRGWQGALEPSPDTPTDADAIDYLFFVHDRHAGNLDASRAYLAWEKGLVQQMDERERGVFRPYRS